MAREQGTQHRKGRGDDAEPRLPERLERVKRPEGDPGGKFENGPDGYGSDYGRETDISERGYGPFGGGGDVGRSHGERATPSETSQHRKQDRAKAASKTAKR